MCRRFESCRGHQVRALITDHFAGLRDFPCPSRARSCPAQLVQVLGDLGVSLVDGAGVVTCGDAGVGVLWHRSGDGRRAVNRRAVASVVPVMESYAPGLTGLVTLRDLATPQ